jgi:hypothetical protein
MRRRRRRRRGDGFHEMSTARRCISRWYVSPAACGCWRL